MPGPEGPAHGWLGVVTGICIAAATAERHRGFLVLIMVALVALCNRADNYIFMLFLLLLLFFPRLISAVGDWMFTILWYMVWP